MNNFSKRRSNNWLRQTDNHCRNTVDKQNRSHRTTSPILLPPSTSLTRYDITGHLTLDISTPYEAHQNWNININYPLERYEIAHRVVLDDTPISPVLLCGHLT